MNMQVCLRPLLMIFHPCVVKKLYKYKYEYIQKYHFISIIKEESTLRLYTYTRARKTQRIRWQRLRTAASQRAYVFRENGEYDRREVASGGLGSNEP